MRSWAFHALVIGIISTEISAQQIEWASEVVDFSDEASPVEFSSLQVLGEPNVLPVADMSPNSWTPGSSKTEHFITVGFDNPLRIRQTAIAEAYNAGAIKQVSAFDESGNEQLLYTLVPRKSEQKGRMFNFFMNQTDFLVTQLKIVFDGRLYNGQFFIDAIGISDSDIPIRALVNENILVRKDINVEPLSNNINSPQNEIRPLLSPNGKTLYFTRNNAPDNEGGTKDPEDIWLSHYNEETKAWEVATNAGAPLNNKGKNFINAISSYGDMTLAVLGNEYGKGDKMKSGVSISNSSNGNWSNPVALEFSNNPNLGDDFDFTMSRDHKVILIATKRGDTNGGKDIYVSFLQQTAVWSEPLNIGSTVNTVSDESSPYLDKDGKTLYFSSTGFSGFGQNDIYVTHRLDETWRNWSVPQNLGPEINSEFDDQYFNIPQEGDYAYFSRFVGENNADIHRVKLPLYENSIEMIAVHARIIDEHTGESVVATVKVNQKMAMEGNSFSIDLEAGKMYRCRVEAEGYILHDELVDLSDRSISEQLDVEIRLKKKDEIITFENITFGSSQAMLLEKSFGSLNEIARLLRENPGIKLEIASHTDNIGTDRDNLELSKLRAEVIRGYLVEQGADPNYITLSWYGESQPVASNETEEGRRKNRRVEFIIKR